MNDRACTIVYREIVKKVLADHDIRSVMTWTDFDRNAHYRTGQRTFTRYVTHELEVTNDLAQKIAGYVNDYLSNFGYEPNCRIGKRGCKPGLTYRTYIRGTCEKSSIKSVKRL